MVDKIDIGLAVAQGKAEKELLVQQAMIAAEEARLLKIERQEKSKRKIEKVVSDLVETLPALIKEAVIKGHDSFSLFEYLPNTSYYKNDNDQQLEDDNIYQEKLLIDNLVKLELKYTMQTRKEYNDYSNYNRPSSFRFISVQVPEC